MRRIYQANKPEAWIGDSAPIPEGWHLDLQTALAAAPVEPVVEVPEEVPAPEEVGTIKTVEVFGEGEAYQEWQDGYVVEDAPADVEPVIEVQEPLPEEPKTYAVVKNAAPAKRKYTKRK